MKLHIGHHFFGSGNIGDDLMLAGFLASLEAAGATDVELTCCSAFDIESQRRRFPQVTWLPYSPEARAAAVEACDAWVGVGDTPFQIVVGPWFLDHLAAERDLCRKHGKSMYFVGIGVNEAEALDDPRAQDVLAGAAHVWARDARSAGLVAGACDPVKLSIGADLAHVALRDHARRCPPRIEAGVTGYVLNFEDPRQLDRDALAALLSNPGPDSPRWLVQETRPLPGSELDLFKALPPACRDSVLLCAPAYRDARTIDELLRPWSAPQYVLSSRYHGALAAAWLGCRVVAVERSVKLKGLASQAGLVSLPALHDAAAVRQALEAARPVPRALLERLADRAAASCRHLLGEIAGGVRRTAPAPVVALATVEETHGPLFRAFMSMINAFAAPLGLRTFTTWSKIWEYPWLWHAALSRMDWRGTRLVDLGSEISPMPWFLASLGARVTLIETDPQWVSTWQRLREAMQVDVDWHLVTSEALPVDSASVDVVTSFSVIEHQRDKAAAVNEVARVLKPGGLFALSFDICEREMGMTFPEWNGAALTMAEFEALIWSHPAFDTGGPRPRWNTEAIGPFLAWHRTTAPHHNYVAAAAALRKAERQRVSGFSPDLT